MSAKKERKEDKCMLVNTVDSNGLEIYRIVAIDSELAGNLTGLCADSEIVKLISVYDNKDLATKQAKVLLNNKKTTRSEVRVLAWDLFIRKMESTYSTYILPDISTEEESVEGCQSPNTILVNRYDNYEDALTAKKDLDNKRDELLNLGAGRGTVDPMQGRPIIPHPYYGQSPQQSWSRSCGNSQNDDLNQYVKDINNMFS